MKRLLPLITILIFSCDNSTEPESKDCAGVSGGSASIDDCGLCTGGDTGVEINYLMDVCGICNGDGLSCCAGYGDTVCIQLQGWNYCYGIDDTISINLGIGEHIEGNIPSEIGCLTNLYYIDLSYSNNLGGDIPEEIGDLVNLEYLDLSYNSFTNLIPESICNLSDECYINFSNNQLCPPYPSCLDEEEIGEQDTSECE